MTPRQQQKSGDNSLNMQIANLNTGMSYSDVRDIARDAALDTFKANFPKLRDEASAVVLARVEEITDKFFAELAAAYPEAISNARDPDMQMALLQAQKEYARTGDKDIGDVLVDILVDRSSQTGRSLRQLLLGEALNTVPQLRVPCMATLSTLWLVSSVVLEGTDSVEGLHNALGRHLIPCAAGLATKNIELRHLEYAGCVSIGIGESDIILSMSSTYQGLFTTGFSVDQVSQEDFASARRLLMPCLRDSQRWQVDALNATSLEQKIKELGLQPAAGTLKNLFQLNVMNPPQIEEELVGAVQGFSDVVKAWRSSLIKHSSLTSIGIAIAHANWKRVTGGTEDLEVWLQD